MLNEVKLVGLSQIVQEDQFFAGWLVQLQGVLVGEWLQSSLQFGWLLLKFLEGKAQNARESGVWGQVPGRLGFRLLLQGEGQFAQVQGVFSRVV